jgi:predicted outer membrane repeat protein
MTGSVDLGNATLNIILGFTPALGQTFTIINNQSTAAVTGTFNGLPEGAVFTVGGSYFRITYQGGDGNDVVLIAVEAPSLLVTTANDVVNSTDGLTSLREALYYAQINGLGTNTITFAPALAGQTVLLSNLWANASTASALEVYQTTVTIQGLASGAGITLAVAPGAQRRHLYVYPNSSLTLANLTLTGGVGDQYGGSVWCQGSLSVSNCTFTGNTAGQEGGAIQSWGGSPWLSIVNSTFTGNTSADYASAIGAGAVQVTLDHLTIANSTASASGAVLWLYNTVAGLTNSLIAGNSPDGVQTYGSGAFAPTSANNLVGVGNWAGLANGVNGNLVGVINPGLGALATNGGPTPTIALLPGSPAINAGTSADGVTTDQRGLPRDGQPDIGAFEFQGGPPAFTSANSATFATSLANTFTVTASGNPAPMLSTASTLPAWLTFTDNGNGTATLAGTPPDGSGGSYPITLNAANGFAPNATQNFTLNVVEKTALAANPTFNTNGLAWALNGDTVNGGPTISNSVFTPTDGTGGETRSAWFRYPLYVGAFQASFTYQDIGGGGADGTVFVIQNDPNGTAAIGGGGGELGYVGISPSVALMLDIYGGAPGGPSGWLVSVNGAGDGGGYSSANYQSTAPVNLDGGNPINVSIRYTGGMLQIAMNDTVTSATFQINVTINIPDYVGTNSAWVGFTGSEGGVLSHQTVSNFSYTPLPTLTVSASGPNTLTLAWPASVYGFTLQSTASLNHPSWTPVSATVTQSNGQNQVVIPSPTGTQFYRLAL